MNIRQVEVFKAIMDTGSVTEAAGRLNVTQPSVSKHLKLLEFDLGLALFARTGNKLMPTPEARALYDQVDRLYRGLDQLNRFSDGLKHHQHGQITVGAMPLIAQRWLPQIVGTFLDAHDRVSFSLPVRSSQWIYESVAASRVDIGIGLSRKDDAGVHRERIMSLPLVCVVPQAHALAEREVITPRDLKGESLVTLSNFDHWRLAVETALEKDQIEPRRRVDTFTTFVACELVLKGVGIAIVDALTALEYAGAEVTIRRFVPQLSFEIFLLRPRHGVPPALAMRFADVIKESAGDTQRMVTESVQAL